MEWTASLDRQALVLLGNGLVIWTGVDLSSSPTPFQSKKITAHRQTSMITRTVDEHEPLKLQTSNRFSETGAMRLST